MTYTVYCIWHPANNFLFQIANVWLVVSYLCPPTLNGLVYLRLFLGLAGVFFALWGWTVLCALDTFVWNLLFFIGNFTHLAYILWSRRTKKFDKDLERIYENLFKPLAVPRHQFKYLAEAEILRTKILSAGEVFVIDGVTETESLSVLLEGRMEIQKHGQLVHIIEDDQFVNSPEWVVSQDKPYICEVTIRSKTQCRIISWDRKKLLSILKRNPYLKTVVDSVVSKDVAQKLFAMSRRINKSGHGLTHSIYSLNEIVHGDGNFRDEENGFLGCETSLLNYTYIHNEKETVL